MEIINKKKEKKAPFVWQGIPTFRNSYEEDKYWETEYTRWVEGYNGLTGPHYCYLNIGSIKRVDGDIIRPIWRDGDHELAHISQSATKKGLDEVHIKRREFGLTSFFGGFMPIYNSLIFPGSVNLTTSADSFRSSQMFSEKTMVMYDGLYERIPERMIPKKMNERTKGFLKLERKSKYGVTSGGSQVIMIETSESDSAAKKVEGYRTKFVFLDELFLHPRAPIVRSSAQASVKQGFIKKGHIVMGGSCGAETEDEARAMKANSRMIEEMIADAEHLGILVNFIPGTLCIEQAYKFDDNGNPTDQIVSFMKNGYSDQDAAKEWILKQRAKLEKANDKTAYWTFVKNYPLSIDEVFEINRQGIYPPEVYAALEVAKKTELLDRTEKRYIILKNSDDEYEAKPASNGPFYINRLPNETETYVSGTDPIPFGENKLNDGSDYAIVIKSLQNESYDAFYAERSLDSDRVVDNAILLQKFYKSSRFPQGAPTMIEANRGEVAIREYRQKGEMQLLANVPQKLGIAYQHNKGSKGWYKNDKSGPLAIDFFIKFLKKAAAKIKSVTIVDQVLGFSKMNTDIADAMVSCEILENEIMVKMKKDTGQDKTFRQVRYIAFEGGRQVVKWKTIAVKRKQEDDEEEY